MSGGWLPAEHGADNRDLRQRVARGLIWTLADNWGRQFLGLAIFIVLANLLLEEDIGLVALAVVFVNLAQIFVDQGLSDALVQRRTLAREHIDTAFWISLGMGALLTLAGIIAAIPLAVLVGQPELEPILQVLSLSFLLTALIGVQAGLLRRELAFRSLALRSLTATLGGGIVGISLALLGFGPWALVAQTLAQATVAVATLWTVSPWRPGLRFSRAHFHELFGFSRNVVASDIVGYFSRNTDNFLIGWLLGTAPLGLYAVGYRILESTNVLLIGIARRITFPALSRLQHDPSRMKRAFFRVTRLSGLIIIPGFVGLALVSQELVVVLFGQRWAESGPVAAVLFLAGPVIAINNFGSSLLNASGQPGIVFRLRLISSVANVLGFGVAVLLFANILAVAAAFTLRAYLLLPLGLYVQRRYARVPMREYLSQMAGIVAATAAMVPAVLLARWLLADQLGAAALLLVQVVVGLLTYGLTMLLVDRRLLGEALETAGHALPGAPPARRILGRRAVQAELESEIAPSEEHEVI